MASIEAALKTLLGTGSPSTIADAVGARIYFDILPQNVIYPAIRLQRISTSRSEFRTLDGRAGYARPRFQIDIYGPSQVNVLALAQAVYTTLEGYRGTPSGLPAGWRIDAISTENESSEVEDDVLSGGGHVYRQRLDIFLMHSET